MPLERTDERGRAEIICPVCFEVAYIEPDGLVVCPADAATGGLGHTPRGTPICPPTKPPTWPTSHHQ